MGRSSNKRLNFHSSQGRVTMQIRGFRIASVPDMHYVYGGVRVFDGGYGTTRDLVAPVEGKVDTCSTLNCQ